MEEREGVREEGYQRREIGKRMWNFSLYRVTGSESGGRKDMTKRWENGKRGEDDMK